MRSRRRSSFIAVLLLIASCATQHPVKNPAPSPVVSVAQPVQAKQGNVISNTKAGYSFTFPDAWQLDPKENSFMVRGPAKESLSDFDAPPNNSSLDLNVSANQAIALASGFCGKVLSENNTLNGAQWSGNYFTCSKYNKKTKQQTAEIFFTVKHRNDFFLFWLSTPAQAWSGNSSVYIPIFQSLQFKP